VPCAPTAWAVSPVGSRKSKIKLTLKAGILYDAERAKLSWARKGGRIGGRVGMFGETR
jgi:hypothetical protein